MKGSGEGDAQGDVAFQELGEAEFAAPTALGACGSFTQPLRAGLTYAAPPALVRWRYEGVALGSESRSLPTGSESLIAALGMTVVSCCEGGGLGGRTKVRRLQRPLRRGVNWGVLGFGDECENIGD